MVTIGRCAFNQVRVQQDKLRSYHIALGLRLTQYILGCRQCSALLAGIACVLLENQFDRQLFNRHRKLMQVERSNFAALQKNTYSLVEMLMFWRFLLTKAGAGQQAASNGLNFYI